MRRNAPKPARLMIVVASLAALAACTDEPTGVAMDAAPGPRMAIPAGPYTAGSSYVGRNGYIEYYAGNLPVIFAAPHGGALTPTEIPDRTQAACGGDDVVVIADANTEQLVMEIRAAFISRTGKYPHVIVNHLHRKKLDPNRTLAEGACGDAEAATAWDEFHDFIAVAKSRVLADYGKGWLTDIHGHGHDIQRLEIGYLLEASDLQLSDSQLNASTSYENESSLRTFSQSSPLSFAALLRGNTSLGTLLANAGYRSVPSADEPAPASTEPYFTGGYDVQQHACAGGGNLCGLQIEHNSELRATSTSRTAYAAVLAQVMEVYLAQNFGLSLYSTGGEVIVDNDNANNDTNRATFSASTNWTTGTLQAEKHLNNYHLADGAGPTNDGAHFRFYIASPGTYSVYAWWTDNGTRTTSASYRVFELDGGTMLADLTRNQQTGGGQWNLLGTYTFGQVGWAKVLMSRSLAGPGTISADAIRVVWQ